jgi:hypothetical protein
LHGDEVEQASPAPSSESGQSCPKCSSPVEAGVACSSCGLAAEHFDSYQGEAGAPDQELASAWEGVVANWDSQDAHENFVELVAARGDYRGGASHYRETASNPDQAQRSKEMLDRIQSMAAAALLSSKPKLVREEEPFKSVVVLLMVLILAAGTGGIYFMIKHKQSGQKTPRVYRSGPIKPGAKVPPPKPKVDKKPELVQESP